MAKRETLELDVRVKGDDDVKDLAENLEDVEDASKKAQRTLDEMLTGFRSELSGTEASVKALGDAFGKGFDPALGERFVAMFRGMGVPFADIIADADKFAAQLKEIDGVHLDAVNKGLTSVSTGLEKVTSSSNQSRSVMANFAGNAVGDLGNMAGATGALNVMLGQLAEYASEGGIKLSQLAKVAGPMAAVGVAIQVISSALSAVKAEKAFNAELVDDFTSALREGQSVAESLKETIQETGELDFQTGLFGGGGFLGIGSEAKSLITLFNTLGLTYEDFVRLLAADDGVQQLKNMKEEFLELALAADEAGDTELADRYQEQAEAARDAAAGMEDYSNSTENAVIAQEELDQFLSTSARGLDEINQALYDQEMAGLQADSIWRRLTADMVDNGEISAVNAHLYDVLQKQLGLNNEEMDKLVNQKTAEALEEQAAAAEKAAEAQEKLSAMLIEVNDAMNTAESRAAGFAAALERLDPGRLGEGMEIAGFVDDLESLGEAVSKVNLDEIDLIPPSDDWQAWLNMPDEAQGVLEAMSGFRDSIDAEMTQAFAAGGGAGVREWAVDARKAITDELKAAGVESEGAVNQVLEALGLLPSQVTTKVDLAVDEQKLAIVDDIVSGLGEIPADVAANISVAVNNRDPDEAFTVLNDYLTSIGDEPVVVTVNAETGEFQVQMDYVAGAVDEATAPRTAVVTADDEGTIGEVSDAADTATEDRELLVIVPKSPTLGAMQDLIDHVARPRIVEFISKADNAGQINAILDGVAAQRYATITAFAQTNNAEYQLNTVARDRTADVWVQVHGASAAAAAVNGVSSAGRSAAAPAGAATLTAGPAGLSAAPTATAVAPVNVTINTSVIGDPYAVQRAVTRAVRGAVRLGGARGARAA